MPTHKDADGLCEVTERCASGNCVCTECPNGAIPGLTSGTCKLPPGSTATAQAGGSTAGLAIDGSASTEWSSGLYFPTGATAGISVTLGTKSSRSPRR